MPKARSRTWYDDVLCSQTLAPSSLCPGHVVCPKRIGYGPGPVFGSVQAGSPFHYAGQSLTIADKASSLIDRSQSLAFKDLSGISHWTEGNLLGVTPQHLQCSFDMAFGIELRIEHELHDAIPVDHIGDSSWQNAECSRHGKQAAQCSVGITDQGK